MMAERDVTYESNIIVGGSFRKCINYILNFRMIGGNAITYETERNRKLFINIDLTSGNCLKS